MLGRDTHEKGRAATPLELLYDLAFAASFGAYYYMLGRYPDNAPLARTMGLAIVMFGVAAVFGGQPIFYAVAALFVVVAAVHWFRQRDGR